MVDIVNLTDNSRKPFSKAERLGHPKMMWRKVASDPRRYALHHSKGSGADLGSSPRWPKRLSFVEQLKCWIITYHPNVSVTRYGFG